MLGRGLGQFYPVQSIVHELDPRAKILAAALFVFGLFMVRSIEGFLVIGVAISGIAAAGRVPFGALLRSLKPVVFILVLTALFQVLFDRRGAILVEWGWLEVHGDGVRSAAFLVLRLLLLMISTTLLTATTSPIALTDGIEDLLSPLARLRLPSHELAMMMSITLRFIPTLAEEADKVMKAQLARGADFMEGGIVRRVRGMVPVLVPLLVGAFKRADELAEAMESRGYRGGRGRTRYRELHFRLRDALALVVVTVVLTAGVLV